MIGFVAFSLPCEPLKGLEGPIVHTPSEIPTAHLFWTLFHVTDSSYVPVCSQSPVFSPMSHARRAFWSLPNLLSFICHSTLRHWLSLTQFEILHANLPHTIASSHCIHGLPPIGDEFPQLAPLSRSELSIKRKQQLESPVWTSAPVSPPSLVDGCRPADAALCCHLAWPCQ